MVLKLLWIVSKRKIEVFVKCEPFNKNFRPPGHGKEPMDFRPLTNPNQLKTLTLKTYYYAILTLVHACTELISIYSLHFTL